MPSDDDDSVMVGVIRDLVRRVESYQQHADDEREKLNATVNATVEAMRKDTYRAIIALQLDASQHRDEHSADRKDRATDAVDRLNRQLVLNVWLGALTILVVINLLLLGYVVIRIALVLYGR